MLKLSEDLLLGAGCPAKVVLFKKKQRQHKRVFLLANVPVGHAPRQKTSLAQFIYSRHYHQEFWQTIQLILQKFHLSSRAVSEVLAFGLSWLPAAHHPAQPRPSLEKSGAPDNLHHSHIISAHRTPQDNTNIKLPLSLRASANINKSSTTTWKLKACQKLSKWLSLPKHTAYPLFSGWKDSNRAAPPSMP